MADPKVLAVARGTLGADVTATTPRGMSDIRVVVLPAVRVVLIRAARTYLQSLFGLWTAFGLGVGIGMLSLDTDVVGLWRQVGTVAGLALFPTFWSVLQNAAELLAKWDVTKPELRG